MKELENLKYEISNTLYKMIHDYNFEEDDIIYMKASIKEWEILLKILKGDKSENLYRYIKNKNISNGIIRKIYDKK